MENIRVIEEIIPALKHEKNYRRLRELLCEIEPADIALIFEDIPPADLPLLYRLLPKEKAAQTFVELSSDMQELLIAGFSDMELKEVIDELYLDDTVDIIEEMPANVVKRILRQCEPDIRSGINEILKYPKDSAGSIMTTELVHLRKNMTVADAFTRIRRTALDKETVYTCYVTDENSFLLGLVSVKDLLMAEPDELVEDIMETNVIYTNTLEDRENAVRIFEKYDFLALPVVDNEKRLVGIITVDDAIDVIREEETEDIEKMVAITPTDRPYMKTGVFMTCKKRIPWLLFLMISSIFTSAVISSFEDALSSCVVLTAFIPMLMGTGGNSGSQASVTVIRGMSLGDIEMKDIFKVLWKEFRVSLLCGVVLAAVNFIKMMIVDKNTIIQSGQIPFLVSFAVSASLFLTVIVAKLIGAVLPILAKKLRLDPAVMASPFITTIVDAVSLLVFFEISAAVLHI